MISDALLTLLRCPRCGGRPAAGPDGALACAACGAAFTRADGYLIAPAPTSLAGRDTHYAQPEYAGTLAYRQVARPLLGAAVRQHWLRRWLFDRPLGPVLEIGCGDGRFAYWNRPLAPIVGLDAVPLFSGEALATVDLVQGDARALPFADGVFQAAYSIDVLEHLDAAGLEALMREARRVLAPGGWLFIFTNSREPSTFQPVIEAQRRLSRALRARGIGDFATDDLRKGDHVKALATYEDFVRLAARHGFAVRRRRFWNGLAQGLIDNVLIRAGEHLLLGAGGWGLGAGGRRLPLPLGEGEGEGGRAGHPPGEGGGEGRQSGSPLGIQREPPGSEALAGQHRHGASSGDGPNLPTDSPANSGAYRLKPPIQETAPALSADSEAGDPHPRPLPEDGEAGHPHPRPLPEGEGVRHRPLSPQSSVLSPRQAVSRRRPVAWALAGLTWAMQTDVVLWGELRSGPFFALLERR